MAEGLQERVLHGFFGVLGVGEDRQRHTEHPSLMPAHQRFKGAAVSRQNASTNRKSSWACIASLCRSLPCLLTPLERAFAEKDSKISDTLRDLRKGGALGRVTLHLY